MSEVTKVAIQGTSLNKYNDQIINNNLIRNCYQVSCPKLAMKADVSNISVLLSGYTISITLRLLCPKNLFSKRTVYSVNGLHEENTLQDLSRNRNFINFHLYGIIY